MENRAKDAERLLKISRTKEEGLTHAIAASELYMKAIVLAKTPAEKSRLKLKCVEALDRAEEIKKIDQWPVCDLFGDAGDKTKKLVLRAPISTRELQAKEKLIILKSSRLHHSVFSQWTQEPQGDEFSTANGLYLNSVGISMSKEHLKDFAGWQRPIELLKNRYLDKPPQSSMSRPTMLPSKAIDLVQDVTADCSVVASLCAALARPGSSYIDLLRGMQYPFDDLLNIPKISSNGKYIFRFNFNGCSRQVVIDDRLPGSKTARTLHVFDRNQPGLLWPALIEKAYLTIRGGYDFPGSNSGTDLWVLTSWIPEQIFLQSDELEKQSIWDRLRHSFAFGDVIITLGTGRLNSQEENVLGLAGEHDYAMLDMREVDGRQEFLVKNPWCNGAVWKPAGKHLPAVNNLGSLCESSRCVEVDAKPSGTFWISFDEVVKNFNSLYLNWNPGLFTYREDHHFDWKIPEVNSPGCFTHNPQYSVECLEGGTVWILMSRHFTSEDYGHSVPPSGPSAADCDGYISLYTFNDDGRRVHLSDNALLRGPYVDSPQTLAKLDMPRNSCYTIVLAQQNLILRQYSFTLSAYSSAPITVAPAAQRYPHSVARDGFWSLKSAGGNAEAATYSSNPQYRLAVHAHTSTPLNIVLEATPRDLAVHVKLLWAAGERVSSVTTQSIAADSGDYRRGCAVAYMSAVPAGVYTIVCSTFDAGQTGSFRLSVEAAAPCELEPIAGEDAGRLVLEMPTVIFRHGLDRVLAPIRIFRVTRLKVAAHHAAAEYRQARSPFRLSVEQGQGPNKKVLCASNDSNFSDAPGGVRTADIDVSMDVLGHGGLWLVVERYGPVDAIDEIQVQLLSDSRLDVGAWGTGDG